MKKSSDTIENRTRGLRFVAQCFNYYATARPLNAHRSSYKLPVIRQILIKLEFSVDFQTTIKCQISQNSIRWVPSCSMWKDRRHDEADSRFLQFYEHA
jgi:hypothetical protein